MASSIFDLIDDADNSYDGKAIRTRLEKEMSYAPLHEPRFSKWMGPNFVKAISGEVPPVGGMKMPNWTGAPIEVREALKSAGGTELLIPIRRRLTKPGVFGGNTLFGTGEGAQMGFRKVIINRSRKSYSPPTGMELQKTKQWAKSFVGEARQNLKDYYSGWTGININLAFLTGYSADLTQSSLLGALGEAYVSHPNFYVAGTAGQIGVDAAGAYTSAPGTAGYETAIATAIDGLADVAATHMTGSFVRKLVAFASRHKVVQITAKDGFQFYPIWLKDSAYFQLLEDPAVVDVAKRLNQTALSGSPLGNVEGIFYGGAAIYSDKMMFCAYTHADDATNVTDGYVGYGPRPSSAQSGAGWLFDPDLDVIDTGDKPVGILVGQSMLTVGTGEDLKITDEMQDHGNKVEIGYDVIQSIVRNDNYDTLGQITGVKGAFWEHTASIAFATYSSYAIG